MRRDVVPDHQPSGLRRWLRRLPIRWRLTLKFAGVMAVLLVGLIAFLYCHFRSDLDYNINSSLRARAQEVASLARNENAADTRGALGTLPTSEDNFVQILDPAGRSSAPAPASPPRRC
jgi:hypothetical protein